MVFHVGINGFYGTIAVYSDITKKKITFKPDEVIWADESINNVNKICEKIQTTLFGEFGYACIFVPEYYTESYHKEFINNVKQIGFKKVFIIGELVNIYLECFINTKEKPKVGEFFWIFADYKLVVWKKTEKKSKIIQFWPHLFTIP